MRIIKIGKAPINDMYKQFQDDPTVSRIHCEIFIDDKENAFLTDMNSTNGTFVNGKRIHKSFKLKPLDIVKAGNSLVRWKDYIIRNEQDNQTENIKSDSLSSTKYFTDNDESSYVDTVDQTKYKLGVIIFILLIVILLYSA